MRRAEPFKVFKDSGLRPSLKKPTKKKSAPNEGLQDITNLPRGVTPRGKESNSTPAARAPSGLSGERAKLKEGGGASSATPSAQPPNLEPLKLAPTLPALEAPSGLRVSHLVDVVFPPDRPGGPSTVKRATIKEGFDESEGKIKLELEGSTEGEVEVDASQIVFRVLEDSEDTEGAATTTTTTSESGNEASPAKQTFDGIKGELDALTQKEDTNNTESMDMLLQEKKSEQAIKDFEFENLGKENAQIRVSINPDFEYKLTGSGKQVAMKTPKQKVPSSFKTDVDWVSDQLTVGNTTDEVGIGMHAFPLSKDHPIGGSTSADRNVQRPLMEGLPTGNSISKKEQKFVKGHLLNDNLGGPARRSNLFPITDWANGRHSASVEEQIKGSISKNFVVEYKVTIRNISTGSIPNLKQHFVNSTMEIDWARLDVAKKTIPPAHHTIIKSLYDKREFEQLSKSATGKPPTTKKEFKQIKLAEFSQDFVGGSAKKPKDLPGSAKETGSNPEPAKTKAEIPTGQVQELGTGEDFSRQGFLANTNFPSLSSLFASNPPSASQSSQQSFQQPKSFKPKEVLSTLPDKLSLKKDKKTDIKAYLASFVTGWGPKDIDSWLTDLRTEKRPSWSTIEDLATKNNLDSGVASDLFKGLKKSGSGVIIGN